MPYQNMNLDDLARHIGMDAREVRRLAEKGNLPGQRVGKEWRFNRAQLVDWLEREMHALERDHVQNLQRAMSDGTEQLVVGSLLAAEAIDMNLAAKSRASILRELVSLAERTGLVYDRDSIIDGLVEREGLFSTALPRGVALPHPSRRLPYATAEPLVALARVPAGIPFGAPDGGLTYLFILVCSHDDRPHLCVLARLSLMLSTDLPLRLREIDAPAEALALLLDSERSVLARRP